MACAANATRELVTFFNDQLLPHGGKLIAETLGCSEDTAIQILRRHVGFCLDACHLALQFETLTDVLRTCKRENILISKVHVSAALKTAAANAETLQDFNESTYLHQVKGRRSDGSVTGWTDLPDLAANPPAPDVEELRCHFHVPLFWEGAAPLASTRDALDHEFLSAIQRGATQHLEIETYTFDVLPDAVRPKSVADCMAQETNWFLEQ